MKLEKLFLKLYIIQMINLYLHIIQKPKLKNKNIFLYQLNFEKVENNISKIIKILRKN